MEDSKLLAGAGSHGAQLHLEHLPVETELFRRSLTEFITAWSKDLERRGAVIGHVKLIAETDIGFLKISVVDTRLGPEATDELKGDLINGGSIKVMAAVLNLEDEVVEESLDQVLEDLDQKIGVHKAGHHCECEH